MFNPILTDCSLWMNTWGANGSISPVCSRDLPILTPSPCTNLAIGILADANVFQDEEDIIWWPSQQRGASVNDGLTASSTSNGFAIYHNSGKEKIR